jgi:hypothetical protein
MIAIVRRHGPPLLEEAQFDCLKQKVLEQCETNISAIDLRTWKAHKFRIRLALLHIAAREVPEPPGPTSHRSHWAARLLRNRVQLGKGSASMPRRTSDQEKDSQIPRSRRTSLTSRSEEKIAEVRWLSGRALAVWIHVAGELASAAHSES